MCQNPCKTSPLPASQFLQHVDSRLPLQWIHCCVTCRTVAVAVPLPLFRSSDRMQIFVPYNLFLYVCWISACLWPLNIMFLLSLSSPWSRFSVKCCSANPRAVLWVGAGYLCCPLHRVVPFSSAFLAIVGCLVSWSWEVPVVWGALVWLFFSCHVGVFNNWNTKKTQQLNPACFN